MTNDPKKEEGRDEIFRAIREGELKLYNLEKTLPPQEAIRLRREFIESETGVVLEKIGSFTIDVRRVVTHNCENMIGTVQVPVGVAGPLRINGEYLQRSVYLPLATTEGALVASVNRGCSAVTRAGGAQVRILHEGMTRAPLFAAKSVPHAKEMIRWIDTHREILREAAECTTRHGRLTEIRPIVVGTNVFVRLEFETQDAMGMNMVTIASNSVADLIVAGTEARLIALSGNLCCDKKPAAVNTILGRGRSVVAGVELSHSLISEIFKTDARSIFEVNYRKNLIGSAVAGSLGFNAHAANIVSALFIACGQDPAHTVDGSTCITTADLTENGLSLSVTLPSLPLGTIGGGTGLETQRESLQLLGIAGSGEPPGTNAKKFAEIVASGILAGELSLLGALAAQHLARAHQELARGGREISTKN